RSRTAVDLPGSRRACVRPPPRRHRDSRCDWCNLSPVRLPDRLDVVTMGRRLRLAAALVAFAALAVVSAAAADPTPPVVTITQAPPAYSNQSTATFEFTVDDVQANVECWVDDAPFHTAPCASPYPTGTLP